MAIEIERKFLLSSAAWRREVEHREHIAQGYVVGAAALAAGLARASVRVRVAGERAWLNLKAAEPGIARAEFDLPMPVADARQVLDTLCDGVIEKIRHHVPVAGMLFEIDEFLGANHGLIVAEIELGAVGQPVPPAPWLGREVSGVARYYNVNLVANPFQSWTREERQGC